MSGGGGGKAVEGTATQVLCMQYRELFQEFVRQAQPASSSSTASSTLSASSSRKPTLATTLTFVDAFFTFLRDETTILDASQGVEQVQQLAMKHVRRAKEPPVLLQPKSSSSSSSTSSTVSPLVSSSPASPSSSTTAKKTPTSSSSTTPTPTTTKTTTTATAATTATTAEPDISSIPEATVIEPIPSNSTDRPPAGNGGTTDVYTWTQTLSELQVVYSLPATVTSKMLDVRIDPHALRVAYKPAHGGKVLSDGALHQSILSDDATWTLELDSKKASKVLTLYLPKVNRMTWWSCVVDGDPSIDVTKIAPEDSSLTDLDGETRKTVEKMMVEQRAKAAAEANARTGQSGADGAGVDRQDVLRRFMEQHPEMDFSQAKVML